MKKETLKTVLKDAIDGKFDGSTGRSVSDAQRLVIRRVLRKLEWSGNYSYCTGWPCCPICKGIKQGFGRDEHGNIPDNSGHHEECELKNAISSIERLR